MVLTILRILILYVLATAAVRIMGKRQIGELQPSELVITILLSEIAAIPMQDTDIPLLNSVVAVLLLVAFEIISSVISMKSRGARTPNFSRFESSICCILCLMFMSLLMISMQN